MMNDARLQAMVRAVTRSDEVVEAYEPNTPGTTIASPRGVFTKTFSQFDSSPEFGTQFEHTVDSVFFVARTVDLALISKGHMVRYKGATPNPVYRVMDKRPDGHGMSALVLHR